MKIILFDIEATGLRDGQICQLAWLVPENGRVAAGNLFFSVDGMSPEAQEIHGLSVEALASLSGGMRFSDHAGEILSLFSSADLLVGHNVSADLRYLRAEFARLGMELPPVKTFCTMNRFTSVTRLKRVYHTNRFKPPKLTELTDYYGLAPEYIAEKAACWFGESGAAHDARFDVAATWLCILSALEKGDLKEI